jgi:hypothetical protein
MKHTAEVVLRALLAGHEVSIPNIPFPIKLIKKGQPVKTFGGDYASNKDFLAFCLQGGINMCCEIDLIEFISSSAEMTEENRISIVSNLALNSSKE